MKTAYFVIAIAVASLLMVADSARDSHPGHVLQRRVSRWLRPKIVRAASPEFQCDGPPPPCELSPRTDGQLVHARGW